MLFKFSFPPRKGWTSVVSLVGSVLIGMSVVVSSAGAVCSDPFGCFVPVFSSLLIVSVVGSVLICSSVSASSAGAVRPDSFGCFILALGLAILVVDAALSWSVAVVRSIVVSLRIVSIRIGLASVVSMFPVSGVPLILLLSLLIAPCNFSISSSISSNPLISAVPLLRGVGLSAMVSLPGV